MADTGGADHPTEADSPFHSSAKANIILRSSDNVDFYVIKAFLSFSSDVFESMFSLELPASPTGGDQTYKGNLPVVVISEESKHVRLLLLFCYPGPEPEIQSFDDILATVVMAEKYAMDTIIQRLRAKVLASPKLTQDPLRVFAIAFRYGWEEIGRLAARKTLEMPITNLPYSRDLIYLTGIEAYRLSEYRYTCAKAIRTWIQEANSAQMALLPNPADPSGFCWWPRPNPYYPYRLETDGHKYSPNTTAASDNICQVDLITFTPRGNRADKTLVSGRLWWTTYFVSMLEDLDDCPTGRTVVLENTQADQAIITAAQCDICGPRAARDMDNFKKAFAQLVDDIVAGVPLNIQFNDSK